jgi:hypothetical protein
MSKVKIVDCVFRLKKDFLFNLSVQPINLVSGQEFHIVQDVLYMNGYPVPMDMQHLMIDWVLNNKELFTTDNRNW